MFPCPVHPPPSCHPERSEGLMLRCRRFVTLSLPKRKDLLLLTADGRVLTAVPLLPGKQPTLPQQLLIKFPPQSIPQQDPESGAYPMRKRAIVSASRPRAFRYSRAVAPSGLPQTFLKKRSRPTCTSSSAMRICASRASAGLENVTFGIGTPSFCAISRTDSGK